MLHRANGATRALPSVLTKHRSMIWGMMLKEKVSGGSESEVDVDPGERRGTRAQKLVFCPVF